MKKKILFVIAVLIIGFLLIVGFFKLRGKEEKKEKQKPAKKTAIKINQLPLEKRPYIILEPKSQTRPQDLGSWLTVTINKADNYKKVKYEVEYQAGNLIQGFMHTIDLTKNKAPFSKEGFFGSESKGKYKYDKNVKGGSILFKFYINEESYDALKTYFNLQNMEEKKGIFTSNDAKASLKVKTKDLKPKEYVVIASTLGLPAELKGKIISEPYGFYASKPVKLNQAALTIKSKKNLNGAKILGWDGKKWQEYKTKVKNNSASALIDNLGTFVLVGK